MKTAKLGAMFLISILALAGIGMGYAAWTDTITITGNINTGSVEWKFTDDSGTWVYKVYGDATAPINEIIVDYNGMGIAYWQTMYYMCTVELIAYSEAVIDPADDHHATVTYWNLFPCIDFEADVTVTYTGTVPGKIDSISFTDEWGDTTDEQLIDDYTTLEITVTPLGQSSYTIEPYELDGLQLHDGDQVHVVMIIHLLQLDTLMGLTGSFDYSVGIIQWNEY